MCRYAYQAMDIKQRSGFCIIHTMNYHSFIIHYHYSLFVFILAYISRWWRIGSPVSQSATVHQILQWHLGICRTIPIGRWRIVVEFQRPGVHGRRMAPLSSVIIPRKTDVCSYAPTFDKRALRPFELSLKPIAARPFFLIKSPLMASAHSASCLHLLIFASLFCPENFLLW